jgi:hypothetical protein
MVPGDGTLTGTIAAHVMIDSQPTPFEYTLSVCGVARP